jgi:hypothetical protein
MTVQLKQALTGLRLRDSELRKHALQRLRDVLTGDRKAVIKLVNRKIEKDSDLVQVSSTIQL